LTIQPLVLILLPAADRRPCGQHGQRPHRNTNTSGIGGDAFGYRFIDQRPLIEGKTRVAAPAPLC
jgi:hypothetical protein